MAVTRVADPTLVINNEAIYIVPNSLSYQPGYGEGQVNVHSAGSGAVQIISSTNVETKIASVKFTLNNTTASIDLIDTWKENESHNSISITSSGFSKSFNNAILISDIEIMLGSEGTIECEWKADSAV